MSIERPRLARCDATRVRVCAFAFSESFRDEAVNTKLLWMRFMLEHRDIATKNARLSVTLSRLSMDDRIICDDATLMQHISRLYHAMSRSWIENADRFGQTRQSKNFLKNRKAIVAAYLEWKYTIRGRRRERIWVVVLATCVCTWVRTNLAYFRW